MPGTSVEVEDYGGPCEVCGKVGPCAFDDEGRPLIHPCDVAEE
jgi:hypothetical protein